MRTGYSLPPDMATFFRECDGASLFGGRFEIPDPDGIVRVRVAIAGEDSDEICPASWFVICDVRDGNYVAIDFESRKGDTVEIIDCFHETIGAEGESAVIARSFTEFLSRLLSAGGGEYWLAETFEAYGYRP